MSTVTPPLNIAQLDNRLQDVARDLGVPIARARLMLCTLIVSQMLPETVAIKGGNWAHPSASACCSRSS